jgi:hypothetical protein
VRRICLALVLIACFAGAAAASGAPERVGGARGDNQDAQKLARLAGEIQNYQHATWRWQRLMGVASAPTEGRDLRTMRMADVEQAVELWRRRAARASAAAHHPPNLGAWLCIHRFEGSWTDGGAPYYGGLQMDVGFMSRYGGWLLRTKGTADHWTPLEQIWTAEKARRSGRGFWPWPNTARMCGLV